MAISDGLCLYLVIYLLIIHQASILALSIKVWFFQF